MLYSFFLGELEKCLEDPERLAPLFIKQVRNHLFVVLCIVCFNSTASNRKVFQQKGFLELSFSGV